VGQFSETEAEDFYGGTEGILAESGWCILNHASFILMEAGGRDIFSLQTEPTGIERL
jgi:hypothetical protein